MKVCIVGASGKLVRYVVPHTLGAGPGPNPRVRGIRRTKDSEELKEGRGGQKNACRPYRHGHSHVERTGVLTAVLTALLLLSRNVAAAIWMEGPDFRLTSPLLKTLALGMRQIEEGKVLPAGDVIERLRGRRTDH